MDEKIEDEKRYSACTVLHVRFYMYRARILSTRSLRLASAFFLAALL